MALNALFGFLLLLVTFGHHALAKGSLPKATNATHRNYDMILTAMYWRNLHPHYFGPDSRIRLENSIEFSFTVHVLKNFPSNVKTEHSAYEKNGRNKYFKSVTIPSTLCGDYQKELDKVPMFRCFHFFDAGFKECPFKKGVYNVSKARCSSEDGPLVAPGRFWRINTTWNTQEEGLILSSVSELTIQRKNKRPVK